MPLSVLLVTVAVPKLEIPPPLPVVLPPVIVSASRVAMPSFEILNTRDLPLPSMVMSATLSPSISPSIVISEVSVSSVPERVIV